MNTVGELNMVRQNMQDAVQSHYKFFRIICKPLKYFLYFAIIQVLWVNFSNYQNSIDTRFTQLGDAIIDVAAADSDYVRRCHLIDNKAFEASEVYPIQNNMTNALNNYVKALYRLKGLISYSSYLELHEFSYCYSSTLLDNIQDGCSIYPVSVENIDIWKNQLLHTVDAERDKNLSFLASIRNFFTKKSKKKYSMPNFSYGLCSASINNSGIEQLQKLLEVR